MAPLQRLSQSIALTLGLLLLTGCQTVSYYHQAASGQLQILNRRESIAHLLQSPDTAPDLKQKLQAILEIRSFAASELKLPVDKQYLSYVDLQRPFAVWNVHAAPEFSLEAKTWWYPIVGSLKYHGFFSERDAHRYARRLEKKGLEVHVEGVEAYSTLGWFNDPVMSSFIHHSDVGIAEILFHELAHQRLFIGGDTDLDEAFATAVAGEGVRRWLLAGNQTEAHNAYLAATRRNNQFLDLVNRTRTELETLFASDHCDPSELREQKARIHEDLRRRYAGLKEEWNGYSGYDYWLGKSLNNAQLNTVDSYYRLVPAFQEMLRREGGDLEAFYEQVDGLARLPKSTRHQLLNQLLPQPTPPPPHPDGT